MPRGPQAAMIARQQLAAKRKGCDDVARHAAEPAGYTEARIATRKGWTMDRMTLDRITANPSIMGGKPCVRGTRVTVGTIVGLIAAGHEFDQILVAYPYLEREDISQALSYAAWRAEEREVDLGLLMTAAHLPEGIQNLSSTR